MASEFMTTSKDLITLSIATVTIILITSFITAYLAINKKSLIKNPSGIVSESKYPVRISLAFPVCNHKIAEKYGNKVLSRNYDNQSSRYDEKFKVHLLFANVDIKHVDRIEKALIMCKISAVNNRLLEFRLIDSGDAGAPKKRRIN